EPDLGEQLGRLQHGGNRPPEELARRHRALAALRLQHERRVKHQHDRRHVRSGVGMGEPAADRADVPHLQVADALRHLGDQWVSVPQQLRFEQLAVRGPGADAQPRARRLDSLELGQVPDVDQPARLSEPELEERQQAVPPGDELRVLADRLERLGDALRAHVIEGSRNHRPPPFACRIAVHTRAGVSGLSMWVTPRGASASHTAFTRVGTDAMVPVSPTPFTPRGFTADGVTVCAVSIFGVCDAFETAQRIRVPVTSWPSSSYTAISCSASPTPWTTPPCTWPSTIMGLICGPQSSTAM